MFGRFPPKLVTMPTLSEWRQRIENGKSLREAHRAMKVWRALWKVMAALKYCEADQDPSPAVVNTEPKGRSQTWTEGEAVRLVKAALRMGCRDLAAPLACICDGAEAPVDARILKLSQRQEDNKGVWFDIVRGKTGCDGALTLSRQSERLFKWMNQQFGDAEPISSMEIFRTRRGAAYRKNSFSEDFRDVRKVVFPGDTRMMLDFRRSGSTEAVAGGVEGTALSAKLANSLSESKKLEQSMSPSRSRW
ncbi:hypothetical protein [Mesorhizobium sp.]|uniref:hypothetical protein n=1 Tax=Mesorhizobium sp. TaxID=1871066 RepID=UPI001218B7EC|nr:hypothetical protein [Mesorhizobium sp.]TIS89681.1 MAG: hypothetical protein E5W89_14160 [Mesorhizobium sp.]